MCVTCGQKVANNNKRTLITSKSKLTKEMLIHFNISISFSFGEQTEAENLKYQLAS